MMVKATGVVRKVDELGRVVLPKELRRTFGIKERDPLEIFVDGDHIMLKKYEANNACMITGEINDDNIELFDGKIRVSKTGAKELIQRLQEQI